MATLPKLVYRFNTIPIKIPARLYAKNHNLILKFIWKFKKTRIFKTILKKKNKMGDFPLSDLQRSGNQDSVLLAQGQIHRSMGHTESPEIHLEIYSQFIFNKVPKQSNRERIDFSTNFADTTG